MKPFVLFSESFSPMGNVSSKGVLNQLGRPNMDLLSLLIREAVQNSWDARDGSGLPVKFGIKFWKLSKGQRTFLQEMIFPSTPSQFPEGHLNSDDFLGLAIFDRRTTGLGGPTRADTATTDGQPRDFVDFLRNVGHPPEKAGAGGTYGFGKAAFYLASTLQTICVHTRCIYEAKPESRFTAAALFDPFQEHGVLFTGRHWWGRMIDGVPEPIIGGDSDTAAKMIGMPNFTDGELGTTILVLQPILNGRNIDQAINLIIESLIWYFWPKMIEREDGTPAMEFQVTYEGEHRTIPDPSKLPPLDGFVQAMKHLKDQKSSPDIYNSTQLITCGNPKQDLGIISLQRFPYRNREQFDIGNLEEDDIYRPSPIADTCHHIAFMREPELVVKYEPGPELPGEHLEYAGVFRVLDEVDAVFSEAEPPTHDDWVEDTLRDSIKKTYIRVAHRKIRAAVKDFTQPPTLDQDYAETAPLGAFSNLMGNLLPGGIGTGAQPIFTKRKTRGSKISGSSLGGKNSTDRPGLIILNEGDLRIENGEPMLVITFRASHAKGSKGTIVRANAAVLLDGGESEKDPPIGELVPEVVQWVGLGKKSPVVIKDEILKINRSDSLEWQVYIRLHESAVAVNLSASAGG